MCTDVILREHDELHKEIRKLREISPFYPQILRQHKPDGEFVMSSNIRKEWQGIWYNVLLVHRSTLNNDVKEDSCFARFIAEAYNIILFYKMNGQFEERCPIQMSEAERLFSHLTPMK